MRLNDTCQIICHTSVKMKEISKKKVFLTPVFNQQADLQYLQMGLALSFQSNTFHY